MGSAATWSLIDVNDIEVIGLAGSTLVECGTSLPIVRQRRDGMFCRFVSSSANPQWLPGTELEQLIEDGRISPLEVPVALPSLSVESVTASPVVVYLNQNFLESAEVKLPTTVRGSGCVWVRMPRESVATWATCLPEAAAKELLNEWAEKLLAKVDEEISAAHAALVPAEILSLADLGLCAATDHRLRWRLYLRYGAFMAPDRVRRTFDSFIQPEFPSCQWDFYLKEMTDFQNVLASQPHTMMTRSRSEMAEESQFANHRVAEEHEQTVAAESPSIPPPNYSTKDSSWRLGGLGEREDLIATVLRLVRHPEEMSGFLQRRKFIVMAICIVGVAIGYLTFLRQVPQYESTALVQVKGLDSHADVKMAEKELSEVDHIIKSPKIVGTAFKNFHLDELSVFRGISEDAAIAKLAGMISTRSLSPKLINVTATGIDPSETQEILESVLESYASSQNNSYLVAEDLKRSLARTKMRLALLEVELKAPNEDSKLANGIERLSELVGEVDFQLHRLKLVTEFGQSNVLVLTPAEHGDLVSPTVSHFLLKGSLLGILAGLVVGFLVEISDRRFRKPEDIIREFGVPIIGHIPFITEQRLKAVPVDSNMDRTAVSVHLPRSRPAEAYRAVRTAIWFSAFGGAHRVLSVTSPAAGDGKSTLALNLAISMAQSGKRTILVEADFRRPKVHKLTGVDNTSGCADVLRGKKPLSSGIKETTVPDFFVLPCGERPKNPAELLATPEFEQVLQELRQQFEYVIVDSPPVLAVTDSCSVAARVDGVIVCMRLTRHTRDLGRRTIEQLRDVGATISGVVINGVEDSDAYGYGNYRYSDYRYYYKNYEYSYGQEANAKHLYGSDQQDSAIGIPILARVGKIKTDGKTPFGPDNSPEGESFRILRTLLLNDVREGRLKILTATSPLPKDGKSTILANLAAAFAKLNMSVVLVEADMRRPTFHTRFGVSDGIGLSDLLKETSTIDDALVPSGMLNLTLITAGAVVPNPSELLQGESFDRTLALLTARFQMVIIDVGPVLAVSDPIIVAQKSDGLLLIVRSSNGSQQHVTEAVETLRTANIKLLGCVVNTYGSGEGFEQRGHSGSYYYSDRMEKSGDTNAKIKSTGKGIEKV